MSDFRSYAATLQRQHEADDAHGVGFARDYIKFGQWLNAGGFAALPVIVGILDLKGMEAARVMALPIGAFAAGLVASAASTAFAFEAISARADSRLKLSDMGAYLATLHERRTKLPLPPEHWVTQTEAEIQDFKAQGESDHQAYVRKRAWAFRLASLAVVLFGLGVVAGSVQFFL